MKSNDMKCKYIFMFLWNFSTYRVKMCFDCNSKLGNDYLVNNSNNHIPIWFTRFLTVKVPSSLAKNWSTWKTCTTWDGSFQSRGWDTIKKTFGLYLMSRHTQPRKISHRLWGNICNGMCLYLHTEMGVKSIKMTRVRHNTHYTNAIINQHIQWWT